MWTRHGAWVVSLLAAFLAGACAGRSRATGDAALAGSSGTSISGNDVGAGASGAPQGGSSTESSLGGAAGSDGSSSTAGSLSTTGGSSGSSAGSGNTMGGASGSGGFSDAAGSSGAHANAAGNGGVSGGAAGNGGVGGDASGNGGVAGAFEPTIQPCNSTDGSGCADGELCLNGYCAATLPRAACDVELAECTGIVNCPAQSEACPPGFVHSIVDECFGPCVPADCCACSAEIGCRSKDTSCDLVTGRCLEPAAPEPRCFLPVNPACDSVNRVFVFTDGRCQESTGCAGDLSEFFTLEECLRRCEGLPQQGECPEGRVVRFTCLQCGGGGGCINEETVCAAPCETTDDCESGLLCIDGACSGNFCI